MNIINRDYFFIIITFSVGFCFCFFEIEIVLFVVFVVVGLEFVSMSESELSSFPFRERWNFAPFGRKVSYHFYHF